MKTVHSGCCGHGDGHAPGRPVEHDEPASCESATTDCCGSGSAEAAVSPQPIESDSPTSR